MQLQSAAGLATVLLPGGACVAPDGCAGRLPGLAPFTAYNVTIAGVNDANQPGAFSAMVAAFTAADTPEKVAVMSMSVSAGGGGHIGPTNASVTWVAPRANGHPIVKFVVYAWRCATSQTLAGYTYVRACDSPIYDPAQGTNKTVGASTPAAGDSFTTILEGLTQGYAYQLEIETFNVLGSAGRSSMPGHFSSISVPDAMDMPGLQSMEGLDTHTTLYVQV